MKRIDIHLVDKGLLPSRKRAKMLIKKGWISINRQVEGKLSLMVDEDVCIEITNPHNVE